MTPQPPEAHPKASKQEHPPDQDKLSFMTEVDAALHRKPTPTIRALSLLTLVMVVLFVLWAAWAEIDETTRGQGQVIASQRTQMIGNLEGGILQELLVHEGQIVAKDAPLARISNETAASTYRDIQGKSNEHRAAIIRLKAEISGEEPVFSPALLALAPHIVEDQQRLYATHKEKSEADLAIAESQYIQKNHEVQELKQRKIQTAQNLALLYQQLGITSKLSSQKLYSRIDHLNLQQKATTLRGDLESLANTIPKAEAAALEARHKYTQHQAELHSQYAEEINKRSTELASLQELLRAGSDRVVRTELRSPVLGTIKQIHCTTVGGVIKPGEPIMEIVPLDDTLLVEVRIRPADIAFIHRDQKAMVKVTAYDFSIYGGLHGVVEALGADTVEDRRGECFYLAKVRTNTNTILYRERHLPIMPGMVCTVDILTGKRTLLNFLLKPILKVQQDALHER
ncbi:MAG: HlyD family type I secretion periplasmic adaptor subunit [Bilophila sp.]